MPRDLFGDVTRPSISIGNRKWYTVPVSLFTHSLVVALLVALPLLAPAVMPAVFADDDPEWITITPPTPPPQPRPKPIESVKPIENVNAVPFAAPEGISPEKPLVQAGFEVAPGPGVVEGLFDAAEITAPPPPPPVQQKPIPVGGKIRAPQKLRDVLPVYPQMAQLARVEGVVIIEATIGADGRVMNARVLRPVQQLLDLAALEAVRQWEFTPTLLNGVPVPVVMTVTVAFKLR